MENRLAGLSERGLTAADEAGIFGMLDDQPLAGAEMMDYDNPSLRGQYSQWYGRPNRGQFVDYPVSATRHYRTPPRMPTTLEQTRSWIPDPMSGSDRITVGSNLADMDLQDTLAHEVGHRSHYLSGLLGTQAGPPDSGIDPYTETERLATPEKRDRWHNVLYSERNAPMYPSEIDRFEGPQMESTAGDWIPVDKEAAARDLEIANQLAANVEKRYEVPTPPRDFPMYEMAPPRRADSTEELKMPPQIRGLLDTVTEPRTKSGVGGDVTPTTLKQAQSMDKAYYLQDGEKKLAVTADQLARFKKSDRYDSESKKSALTQWANIAGKEGLSGLIPKKTIADVKTQKPGNLSGNNKFLANWAKHYYTGEKQDDPDYLAKVESRLKTKVTKGAADAIASAVEIFGTDKRPDGTRMNKELMRKTLEDIGKVESGYRTRIAGGGRPERGFWQVLPSTAKDALKNAKGYFGPKFNDKFSEYGGYAGLNKLSKKELSDLLEKDDALGAAFAAVQVLRTFDK